ncbi:hypothetical protein RM530_17870, partial [Algiphilus sp. W345]
PSASITSFHSRGFENLTALMNMSRPCMTRRAIIMTLLTPGSSANLMIMPVRIWMAPRSMRIHRTKRLAGCRR